MFATNDIPAVDSLITIRPQVAPALLRMLEREYSSRSQDNDPLSPEYADTINRLIEAVQQGRPIDLAPQMATRDLDVVETVRRYLVGAIGHTVNQGLDDAGNLEDWRYLSDLAAVAADIETVLV